MEHKISIMSHLKEKNAKGSRSFRHESSFTMSEAEILDFAVQLYKEEIGIDKKRVYEASIDQTVI